MVSLRKGEGISLAKTSPGLRRVRIGLGWDVARKGGLFGRFMASEDIDLDASCLMFDAAGALADTVWFRQLASRDGSIMHTGDNLTGAGDGDDEVIRVDLEQVPAAVATLVFTVSSFRGQTFANIANAFCRAVDEAGGRELARFDLSGGGGSHTAQIMAKLHRHGGEWTFTALGLPSNGRTFHDMMPDIIRQL